MAHISIVRRFTPCRVSQHSKPSKAAQRQAQGQMKVFLDMGTHQGQGLKEFHEKLGFDPSWKIHTWECNPVSAKKWLPGVAAKYGAIPHGEAIWVHDRGITLRQQSNNGARDGWGSTVMGDSIHHDLNSCVEVPSIDIVAWMDHNISSGDEVYIKMDIEGAEFVVLRHMLSEHKKAGLPCESPFDRIKFMAIEFHERYIPEESTESRLELMAQLTELLPPGGLTQHW